MISKNNRPFTDAEFIKKCMLAVVDEICPDKKKDFEDISLSARTCVRRTEELGNNLMQQLKEKIKSLNFFSLAMDEKLADLCSLKGTTTGDDLFESIDKSLNNLGLEWKKLVSVTTDGGKNMSGSNKGVVGRIKKKMLQNDYEIPMNFHCIIHQEALCCKVLACQEVMSVVISSINFIRKNGLGHRQFQNFLDEIESEYGDVIYFTEVRWLSRGAALKRFFDLRIEIEIFMNEKNKIVSELSDESWIIELAFLTDITTFLNELNIKLQGKRKLLSDMYTDIKSFQWDLIKPKFLNIIEQLQNEFSTRFKDFYKYDKEIKLFQNPFQVDINNVKNNLQMEVIELQNDEVLKNYFREATSLPQFYSCLPLSTFPGIRQFAQKFIAAFASTYICEQTFSIVKYRKSKHSSRLSDENLRAVLRVSTTSLQADIEKLTNKPQAQKSH
ncbi:general transcription factor II-I repeat domain-containing protein 2A-like [Metopolophium dirhodum]|uniref:general transcription factor II-I repeat domain-containing protein 2A-like n=1 Tax=Metopolophium dirhodum TaxID=44670 RepID=UPI00298F933E|nr:general transcription factor II-I repeat domain-containing protein 2A-like [Metopolophium dirhodum]